MSYNHSYKHKTLNENKQISLTHYHCQKIINKAMLIKHLSCCISKCLHVFDWCSFSLETKLLSGKRLVKETGKRRVYRKESLPIFLTSGFYFACNDRSGNHFSYSEFILTNRGENDNQRSYLFQLEIFSLIKIYLQIKT